MYVCICRVVTDKQVRQCVEEGVDSMRRLRETLGVASECGKCARCVLQVLRESKPQSMRHAAALA